MHVGLRLALRVRLRLRLARRRLQRRRVTAGAPDRATFRRSLRRSGSTLPRRGRRVLQLNLLPRQHLQLLHLRLVHAAHLRRLAQRGRRSLTRRLGRLGRRRRVILHGVRPQQQLLRRGVLEQRRVRVRDLRPDLRRHALPGRNAEPGEARHTNPRQVLAILLRAVGQQLQDVAEEEDDDGVEVDEEVDELLQREEAGALQPLVGALVLLARMTDVVKDRDEHPWH